MNIACGSTAIARLVTLGTSLLLISSGAAAQSLLKKNVLIINQVGRSHRIYALVTEEIQSTLTDDPDYQVEFYAESLDSMSLTDESLQRDIQAWLVY